MALCGSFHTAKSGDLPLEGEGNNTISRRGQGKDLVCMEVSELNFMDKPYKLSSSLSILWRIVVDLLGPVR